MKPIEQLESEIRYHNHLYWDLNAPAIPDQVFDALVQELKERDPDNPVLAELGERPTTGSKFTHKQPMLSLDKSYEMEGLHQWWSQSPETPVVASHKVDGLAASLHYNSHGFLTVAATRGNGRVGDVITENVKQIDGVPFRIPFGPCEVRGEIYMPLDTFNEHYKDQFANPRNLAAGATKQKDPSKTRMYGVRFLAYDLRGAGFETVSDGFKALTNAGFDVVPFCYVQNSQMLESTITTMRNMRSNLNFEVDGIVLKFDSIAVHDDLGETSHHPRFAIAYKYQGDTDQSVIRGIEWSVSRTGAINPVAVIDPVNLSGATVTRVSLHNLGIMEKLAGCQAQDPFPLGPGAVVYVTRRGGVIPHIESMVSPATESINIFPDDCPDCGMPVKRDRDFLFADHADWCTSVGYRRLQHFTSTVEMIGIGPKLLERLWDDYNVREPADLYQLEKENLDAILGGDRAAQKVLTEIETKRIIPLDLFLTSLGIEGLGKTVGRKLASVYTYLQAVREAGPEDFASIDGIGFVLSQSIHRGLHISSDMIDRLLVHVDVPPYSAQEVLQGGLSGESFVFTGAMQMKRADAQKWVRDNGGFTPESVSSSTTYLVLGDSDYQQYLNGKMSSKTKAAVKIKDKGFPIKIISETMFIMLMGEFL